MGYGDSAADEYRACLPITLQSRFACRSAHKRTERKTSNATCARDSGHRASLRGANGAERDASVRSVASKFDGPSPTQTVSFALDGLGLDGQSSPGGAFDDLPGGEGREGRQWLTATLLLRTPPGLSPVF